MESPLSKILSRVSVARETPRGSICYCPAHPDREDPSLSVREGCEGQVLLKCFAGCTAQEVVAALGLALRDLYPLRRAEGRRRPAAPAPRADDGRVRRAFAAEICRVLDRRPAWDAAAPVATDEKNLARATTAKMLEIRISPLPRRGDECRAPWDRDPLWPAWFGANLRQAALERWHAGHPEARPGETDPAGPSDADRAEAARRTAAQIRLWTGAPIQPTQEHPACPT